MADTRSRRGAGCRWAKARPWSWPWVVGLVCGAVLVINPDIGGASAELDPPACSWATPVDAEVIDGFRPPDHRYGPGNRGLEYGVDGGEAVLAVADGQVGFVGPVGGRVFVVVEHDGGLRSTYGPVASREVVRGQQVRQGERLAVAVSGFHLTARVGDHYIDPQALIDGRCGRARLVAGPRSGLRSGSERLPVAAPRVLGSGAGRLPIAGLRSGAERLPVAGPPVLVVVPARVR